ncbi:MAG TPA: lytic transglycosylase domain-containing protein [Pyrinomonadaceae bacterium]
MKRSLVAVLILLTLLLIAYFTNQYWIHRYDALITRQAGIYQLDPDLVWSIIYEETYFSPWKVGRDGEIGLMQVTPAVGREWAAETGMHDLERQMASNPASLLHDPERNIQIGCWYLEKFYERYRDSSEAEPRMIAAYNAGLSRAEEWNHDAAGGKGLSGNDFISRIDIPSTRAYVTSIMQRYRQLKAAKGASGNELNNTNR